MKKICLAGKIFEFLVNLFYELIFLPVEVVNRCGPFECDQCGLDFKKREAFSLHFQCIHLKKYSFCDLCPKKFPHSAHLTIHKQAVHEKLRPFACDLCEYTSYRKTTLQVHMLRHSSKKTCEVCFKSVVNMYDHLKSHIEVKCSICQKICDKRTIGMHYKRHKKSQLKTAREIFKR